MKIRNTITKLVTMTIAVEAIGVIGSIGMPGQPAGVKAQVALGDGSVRFISSPIGYVPGQTLRFRLVNPQAVLAGQFRSCDFNRDAISAGGEPGTGRLQLRAEISYRYADSPEPISPDS